MSLYHSMIILALHAKRRLPMFYVKSKKNFLSPSLFYGHLWQINSVFLLLRYRFITTAMIHKRLKSTSSVIETLWRIKRSKNSFQNLIISIFNAVTFKLTHTKNFKTVSNINSFPIIFKTFSSEHTYTLSLLILEIFI